MKNLNDTDETANKNGVDLTRRKFLSGAKVLGAVGAAALVGKTIEVEASVLAEPIAEPAAGSGYRETEHIRKYYHSARY
jgi:hypothetical protein